MGTEVELKRGLSTEALLTLTEHLGNPQENLMQTNVYFTDPGGVLAEEKTMVRARGQLHLEDIDRTSYYLTYYLTVKKASSYEEGVFTTPEFEEQIPSSLLLDRELPLPASLPFQGTTLGEFLGVEALEYQGSMTVIRKVYLVQGYKLECDLVQHQTGDLEAEVEVETDNPDGARDLLDAFAQQLQFEYFEQPKSKYARFLENLHA